MTVFQGEQLAINDTFNAENVGNYNTASGTTLAFGEVRGVVAAYFSAFESGLQANRASMRAITQMYNTTQQAYWMAASAQPALTGNAQVAWLASAAWDMYDRYDHLTIAPVVPSALTAV